MNKKNIILLICSIIFLIIAIAIFVFANTQNTTNNNVSNQNHTSQTPNSTEAKDFSFSNSDEKNYSLEDFNDKPIALILWSSDAENALETIETAIDAYNSSEYKDSINLLIVNTNEKNTDIKEIVSKCNFEVPIYFDLNSTASNKYYFSKLPYLVFIKADGTISNELNPNETQKPITADSFSANLELLVFEENS